MQSVSSIFVAAENRPSVVELPTAEMPARKSAESSAERSVAKSQPEGPASVLSIGDPALDSVIRTEADLPRGIKPSLLLGHVRNTVPYFFEKEFRSQAELEGLAYLNPLWAAWDARLELAKESGEGAEIELSHSEYFHLCLCAHWATVGNYVPTDVDSQIRFKLWHPSLPVSELDRMAERVLEAYSWSTTAVSQRWVRSPLSDEVLSGHQGEWFSVAVAAYAANRRRNPARAAEVLEKIQFEVTRQAKVYLQFKRARDGVGLLKAATLIAHNLGDLDRVIETWSLVGENAAEVSSLASAEVAPLGSAEVAPLVSAEVAPLVSVEIDPLVEFAYRAGHESGSRALRFSGALAEAGRLNKAFMAPENHRHLPLRSPRGLRRSLDLILPVAPFFDEWGERLARHPSLEASDIAEIVDALITGWEKLKGPEGKTVTYAYPRAIAGLLERYPGGMSALASILPARVERNLKAGLFRSLVSVPRQRFEEQWAQMALNFVK